MVALRIYYIYMVQARKETHDHVSVREKCLNHSRPNGVSVVGINKAILISTMILRVGTTPKSSSIGGRKISPQSYSKLSPIYLACIPNTHIKYARDGGEVSV